MPLTITEIVVMFITLVLLYNAGLMFVNPVCFFQGGKNDRLTLASTCR